MVSIAEYQLPLSEGDSEADTIKTPGRTSFYRHETSLAQTQLNFDRLRFDEDCEVRL